MMSVFDVFNPLANVAPRFTEEDLADIVEWFDNKSKPLLVLSDSVPINVFDTEKRNFLEIDEIKVIVTSYGDVFTDEETREMLRDANVRGDGNVFYEDFVDSLFSVAPELYQLKAEFLYEDPNEDPSVPPDPEPEPQPEVLEPKPTLPPPSPGPKKKGNKK
nr:uncharacterized protein LOC117991485 [Maniola hyperantus]